MDTYNFTFHFTHVPPIMTRGRHALFTAIRDDKKVLLGAKQIYPKGIVRFPGGGIEEHETPFQGAVREIQEELGIQVNNEELHELARFSAEVSDNKDTYHFSTHLFTFLLENHQIKADDDLDGVVFYSLDELDDLAKRYEKLSDELIFVETKAKVQGPFRWSDYGKLYGKIHEIAAKLLKSSLKYK